MYEWTRKVEEADALLLLTHAALVRVGLASAPRGGSLWRKTADGPSQGHTPNKII